MRSLIRPVLVGAAVIAVALLTSKGASGVQGASFIALVAPSAAGGRFGRRAEKLATLLEVGETLPDALGEVDGLMPRDAVPSVRVGYRSGALARGLASPC